jgi:glucose-fructose oxidoreductase
MAKRSQGQKKIRYAVVGLGWISQEALLPAFKHARRNSELVALVSDDRVKRRELSRLYHLEHTYDYDQYDQCLESGEIDAVYIGLPNHLHRDFTVRAARRGIHVLCEKPMAVDERECRSMIEACARHRVKLMIAYRLHFEPANLKAIEVVNGGRIGEPRIFNSVFTQQVEGGNIRLRDETGGGTLPDIGIYCLNAARYLFRAEPDEVFAYTARRDQQRFREVEEMASVVMRFPEDRLASFTASFGASDVGSYQVVGTKGDLRVDPAYTYHGDLKHTLSIKGKKKERVFPKGDQFGPQLLYFSDCIRLDRQPEPSGEEGLIDVRIINALYKSAETGRPVRLRTEKKGRRPSRRQRIRKPPVKAPPLVRAEPPEGK